MNVRRTGWLLALLGVLLVPRLVLAQATGSIAGTVKDTSGAVLPGVTVEAASPALIEKVRTVVTDGGGNYKIVDLRPGMYTVTVTLPGFSTFKREGIELSAGFTANVSADLKVGSLEETVTVTGASPIVDVQNARTQQVLRNETLNNLPTGAKNMMAFAAMTLGAVTSSRANDVGGDKGEQATGIVLHGGRGDDGRVNWDGMSTNVFFGGAGGKQRTYYFNTVAVQEVVIDTGGNSAESETGGANINMVPREGGNTLSLLGTANYTGNKFSAKAVPADLKARGITDQSSLRKIYDYGVGIGGPIRQDKAWFYGTYRTWGAQNFGTDNYFNTSTNNFVYTPDLSRQAYADTYFADESFRVTWQVTGKNKINHEIHLQNGCSCWLGIGRGGRTAPEATTSFDYGPQVLNQTTWSYTATNKLLVQVGASFLRQNVAFIQMDESTMNKFTGAGKPVFPGPTTVSVIELNTGYRWGALPGGLTSYSRKQDDSNNFNQRVAISYITGSHALKVGTQTLQGHYDFYGMQDVAQLNYSLRAGVPVSLTQFAGPFQSRTRLSGISLFAQDQWTLRRLTMNLGVRYDKFSGRTLAQDIPAGLYRPAFHVDETKGLPDFKDITPRIGIAYDVFGNGRTAIKATFGKYLMGQGGGLSQQGFAPSVAIVSNVTRNWSDANGNFVADCALSNLQANGECGVVNNLLFGQPFSTQSLSADARGGFGNREYNYQWNVQLQQELRPGLGLAGGFFHTQWGNMSVTRNTLVTPADFTQYCVTTPTDTRLSQFSNKQVCGLYDRNVPGGVINVIDLARNLGLGNPEESFNGFEIGMNARWGNGKFLNGGVSVGRETVDWCYVNGHPELTPQVFPANYPRNADYCRVTSSWWNGVGSQAKVQMIYPLPYGIVVSGSFKNMPGVEQTATVNYTNAQISPSLGRTLSQGAGTIVPVAIVPLATNGDTPQGTLFDQRLNQVDLRLSKSVKLGRTRLNGVLDLYNVGNSRAPQSIIATYGATWLRPASLLGGRLWKFGAQVDW